MKIHIDNRELKVIPYFKDLPNVETDISTLKRGDYVISYNDQILHLFERKSMSDLVASLKSHNLHIENMIKTREETNCKLGYILEHKRVFYEKDTLVKGIKWNVLQSVLDTIYIKYDIPIIITKNPEDTASRISDFVLRYQKLISKGMTFNIKGGLNLLTDKIEKSTYNEVIKMWICIPGIGLDTAEALIKRYSFIDLLSADIKDIQCIKINNNCIGKRLDQIIPMYQGENSPLHRKILTAIQGISEQRAIRILSNTSFKDILNVDIANMTINNKKLGQAISDRIKRLLTYKDE